MALAAGQTIHIDNSPYRLAENPNRPGFVVSREGQQSVVYQLISDAGMRQALKVFQPRFREARVADLAARLSQYAMLPGLQACERTALTPDRRPELLAQFPDLAYSVFMPWVDGDTWQQVLLARSQFPAEQALRLARSLAYNLASMEERGLAHCDLSGQNLLVKIGGQAGHGNPVALVDLEEMYGAGLPQPGSVSSGSSGYTHRLLRRANAWSPVADRFAGAVLIAEMLGMVDETIAQCGLGESYFDPGEMGVDCQRFNLLDNVMVNTWGDGVARLFSQAWHSETLSDCPAFSSWLAALPSQAPLQTGQKYTDPRAGVVQINGANPPVGSVQPYYPQDLQWNQPPVSGGSGYGTQKVDLPPRYAGPEGTVLVQPPGGTHDPVAYVFDQANAAYAGGQLQQAEALLNTIVSANPGYYNRGVYAGDLLNRVQADSAQKRKARQMKWLIPLLIVGGLLICGVALGGGFLAGNLLKKTTATPQPTSAPAVIPPVNTSLPPVVISATFTPLPTNTFQSTYTPYPTWTNPPEPTLPPPPTNTRPAPPTAVPVASCCTLKVTNRGSEPLYIGSSMPWGGNAIKPGWYVTFKMSGPQMFTVYFCEISQDGKPVNCQTTVFYVEQEMQSETVP